MLCWRRGRWRTRLNVTTIASNQPTPPAGIVSQALLASNVSCSFSYAAGATQRNAVLVITASLTLGGETVSLFKQVQVNNVP